MSCYSHQLQKCCFFSSSCSSSCVYLWRFPVQSLVYWPSGQWSHWHSALRMFRRCYNVIAQTRASLFKGKPLLFKKPLYGTDCFYIEKLMGENRTIIFSPITSLLYKRDGKQPLPQLLQGMSPHTPASLMRGTYCCLKALYWLHTL